MDAPRQDWEAEAGTDRLDLMTSEIADLTALAEEVCSRRTPDGVLDELMARIDAQERVFDEVATMIAEAPRCPIRISEMIPNVMIPQWHRGSDWALAARVIDLEEHLHQARLEWRGRPPAGSHRHRPGPGAKRALTDTSFG